MINITQEEIMQNWSVDNCDTPLLTVSCTAYNQESYIAQTLDGFLMQKTNFPFEVIVHDDASIDKTSTIIREYEKKFPAIIRPIYETENQYSKNDGSISKIMVPLYKGKYIAYCEGDDYWIDEKKLQMQVDFLEENLDYGMCYTNFNIYNQDKKLMEYALFNSGKKVYTPDYNSLDEWIITKGYTAPMTWVLRKSLRDSFESINSCDNTFVMFAHFLAVSKGKCFKNNVTAVYRKLQESASHSKDINKLYMRTINLFETQNKLIRKYNLSKDTKQKCEYNFYTRNWKIFIAMNDVNRIDASLCYQKSYLKKILLKLGKKKNFSHIFKHVYLFARRYR